ncbi:MAG: non-homologous end-joining DNA ligase [Alphaproteobacteria bacterium]|nr:non-homologous end-joining DNA ligase [Alphaproteobacteria bacterium]
MAGEETIGLKRYRTKRDFDRSPEPSGLDSTDVLASEHRRFVVHKHDASRLHYDLRLEVDGVFRSWAVTRGPSLDPGEKRLAVEVEEHPLAYGDFEGTIPKGEYGGGTVMIWDRGFWAPQTDDPVAKSLDVGELKFILAGTKLHGSWVLVRMKPKSGDTKHNWLLIKHKDPWATPGRDTVLKQDKSVASGRTLLGIAKGKEPLPTTFLTTGPKVAASAQWSSADTQRSKRVGQQQKQIELPKMTHPERVLWPDCGYSKTDLANYLLAAAPWMMEHLAGRPCSLLRAPEGIDRDMFFQRHAGAGLLDRLTQITVSDDKQAYLQVDDAQTLVDLAQYSTIEFHPWNCAPFSLDIAGRLVFDLDPDGDVDFNMVLDASRRLRDRLEELGLVAFCKTTGGKGLHVVTPLTIEGGVGFEQAKLFSQTLAAQMADAEPDRYLISMSKRRRKGRIFIDYLRNDRKATAVSPLSPRARPGALVSMPLNWSQVRKGLDPSRFTIKTALSLLDKSNAWADYANCRRPLDVAIGKLLEDS